LDVPFAFTAKSLTEQRSGDDRAYLNGEKDIHESSLDLQQMVRSVYLEAAKSDDALQVIDCSNAEGGMDSPQGIFSRIEQAVAPLLDKL
jgi:dTMP kinase